MLHHSTLRTPEYLHTNSRPLFVKKKLCYRRAVNLLLCLPFLPLLYLILYQTGGLSVDTHSGMTVPSHNKTPEMTDDVLWTVKSFIRPVSVGELLLTLATRGQRGPCVPLHSYFYETLICTHDPDVDQFVSKSLVLHGTWEASILYVAGSILQQNENLMFLDLGCNIGVYTLNAAMFDRRVVSVDPFKPNLELLARSLRINKLEEKVTLLWNAVSNVHENVTLVTRVGNVGGTSVQLHKHTETKAGTEVVGTITLDDLVPYFNESSVFIKMDIETYELNALKGAKAFFEHVDVTHILMEWVFHKRSAKSGQEIIDLLSSYGLFPHINAHLNTVLDTNNYRSWPDDIFWIKY